MLMYCGIVFIFCAMTLQFLLNFHVLHVKFFVLYDCVVCVFGLVLLYLSVPYIIHFQSNLSEKINSELKQEMIDALNSINNNNRNSPRSNKLQHWSQVVITSQGYEMFINHLESEFSVENLLFITEVCVMIRIYILSCDIHSIKLSCGCVFGCV